jgi:hypothetical protein
MTKEEHDLMVAIGIALYTLLGQMPARERQATQEELFNALAAIGAEPIEER